MSKGEVLVVGAGVVGLITAAELIRHGMKCRIIHKNPVHIEPNQIVRIQPRTLEVFEDMGILTPILEKGIKITNINLYSPKKRLLQLDYQKLDTPYNFVINIQQHHIESILTAHLQQLGLTIQRNNEIYALKQTGTKVEVELKHDVCQVLPDEYEYVIICDKSECSQLLNMPSTKADPFINWATFNAKIDMSYNPQDIHIIYHKKGILSFSPLPQERIGVTCQFDSKCNPSNSSSITYDLIVDILRERIEDDITIQEPLDFHSFVTHSHQLTKYRKGSIFFSGESHSFSNPILEQKINIGVQNIYNIVWKIAQVSQKQSPPAILNTYNQERFPINKIFLSISNKIIKISITKNILLQFLRNATIFILGLFNKRKESLTRTLSFTNSIYKCSNINMSNTHNHPPKHIEVGLRAPDQIIKSKNKEVRLFDLFRGTHHTLLLFSGIDPSSKDLKTLENFHNAFEKNTLINTFFLHQDKTNSTFLSTVESYLLDSKFLAHTKYGITNSTVVFIRPDGYISYIQEPPDIFLFKEYLNTIFFKP